MPERRARDAQAEPWPTLTHLEPVANYLAARFAQAGTATRKVQDICQVLQYYCLREEGDGLRIEFGLLGGWLTRSRSKFRDDVAFGVLCAVLRQFADRHDQFPDPTQRRDLHRLLTDWLSVLTWKFKALSDKDEGLLNQVRPYAKAVTRTTQAVAALRSMSGEDSLAQRCRQIAAQLREDTADQPYLARMAVGVGKE